MSQPKPTTATARPLPNILSRCLVDLTAAASAALIISPAIYIIDRAIIENASGRAPLTTSITSSLRQFLTTPIKFMRNPMFGLVFMVYGGTYLTANSIDTWMGVWKGEQDRFVGAGGVEKFVATTSANIGLGLIKDRELTKAYGAHGASPSPRTAAPTRPQPPSSIISSSISRHMSTAAAAQQRRFPPMAYVLFTTRDSLTVFSSFNVPAMIAPYAPGGLTCAQLLTPCVVQFLSTPFHLFGLSLYNEPGPMPTSQRLQKMSQLYLKSTFARIGRILPAFGVGGVVNRKVRNTGLEAI